MKKLATALILAVFALSASAKPIQDTNIADILVPIAVVASTAAIFGALTSHHHHHYRAPGPRHGFHPTPRGHHAPHGLPGPHGHRR